MLDQHHYRQTIRTDGLNVTRLVLIRADLMDTPDMQLPSKRIEAGARRREKKKHRDIWFIVVQ